MGCIPKTITATEVHKIFSPFGAVAEVFFLSSTGDGSRPPHNGAAMVKFVGPRAVRAAYEAIMLLHRKVLLVGCAQAMQVGLARGWEHIDLVSELRKQGYFQQAYPSMQAVEATSAPLTDGPPRIIST